MVLKIPDLSEQRPSLIPGDRVSVTDPPNCTKRLGKIIELYFIIINYINYKIKSIFNILFVII